MADNAFDHRTLAITPRNEDFGLTADMPREWLDDDPVRTYWFNAMSILFPEGERLFMDSVRAFKDEIDDPVLLQQVRGFIAQEAIHGREHERYNELLEEQGLNARLLEKQFKYFVRFLRRYPAKAQLAGTCAAEHFTAVLAHSLLSRPELMDRAHPTYRAIWMWHAIEETEHKGVAFDVYRTVTHGPGAYFRRVGLFCFAMMGMNARIFYNWCRMMAAAGELKRPKNWLKLADFLWGRTGFYRRMVPEFLSYFRPGFHPWDHDNRAVMNRALETYREPPQAAIPAE